MNIAVILAGGRGLRVGGETPKQMLDLGGKPLILWSVDTFHDHSLIDSMVIVSEKSLIDTVKELLPQSRYPKISSYIEGGEERSDSSFNALTASDAEPDDIILFHDAARPFVSTDVISRVIEGALETGACGCYIPSSDTISIIENNRVEKIPDRKNIFAAQTPQGFRFSTITEAHGKRRRERLSAATDDVSLVKLTGTEIKAVSGSEYNFKITTPLDLKFAQFLVSEGMV